MYELALVFTTGLGFLAATIPDQRNARQTSKLETTKCEQFSLIFLGV